MLLLAIRMSSLDGFTFYVVSTMECELHGRGLELALFMLYFNSCSIHSGQYISSGREWRGRQEGLTPSVTVSEDGAWKEVIREGPNP